MDTKEAAQRWAETWQRAWEERDTGSIVALYADSVVYSSEPFRDPYRGRDGARAYVAGAFAEEDDVRAWFGQPIVTEDRAAIQWWASLREEGRDVTLAGTSILTFDSDGSVVDQWDTWNTLDERRAPPHQWGRSPS